MKPFFRPEAVDAQRLSWLGGVRLIRPLSMSLLTVFTVGVAALVIAFLFVGEYTRKVHLSGVLVPEHEPIRLLATVSATVLERHALEGQAVKRGDMLFVLAVDRTEVGDAASTAKRRSPLAHERGLQDGPTSRAAAQPTASDAIAPEARSALSPAQHSVQATVHQRILVRAPQDGVLTAVRGEPGQIVVPATALASLAPEQARLQAHLYAPASAISFLHPKQPVRLRYPAFAHQTSDHHPGQVLQVSRTPLQAGELMGLALSHAIPGGGAGTLGGRPNAGEPMYRISVAIDDQTVDAEGQAQPLAAGMQLEADVLLDRRRLIEWMFEPMFGVAGRG